MYVCITINNVIAFLTVFIVYIFLIVFYLYKYNYMDYRKLKRFL